MQAVFGEGTQQPISPESGNDTFEVCGTTRQVADLTDGVFTAEGG